MTKTGRPNVVSVPPARTNRFDNGNMKAMSLLLAAIVVVLVTCMDVASSAQKDIPKTAIEVMLSVLYAISAVWIFVTLVLGWTQKLTTSYKYRSRKNNKMNFQKIGAIVFGMGAMVYSSLGIAEFISMVTECRHIESLLTSLLSICFTSLQVYFLLVYSKVTINMGRVVPILSRFGLMVIMGTNISVWIHTTISEARHSSEHGGLSSHGSTHDYKNHSNDTDVCAGGGGGMTLQRQLSSYLYPCVIEYSLITSTNIYLIWSKVCQPSTTPSRIDSQTDVNPHARCNGHADPAKSVRKSSSIAKMEHLGHGNHHHGHFDHIHGHHGHHGHVNRAFSAVLADIIEESGSEAASESSAQSEPPTPKQQDPTKCSCFNSFREGGSGHHDSCPQKEKESHIHFDAKADDVKFYFEPSESTSEHHDNVEQLHEDAAQSVRDQVTRHVNDWHRHNDHNHQGFLEASDLHPTGKPIHNVASSVSIATSAYEAPHMPDVKEVEYYNNHCGLYFGLTLSLATLVTIIVFLYLLYRDNSDGLHTTEFANAHLFVAKISLNVLNIFGLFVTHFSINSLMKKDPKLRGLRLGKEGRRHTDEKHQQHQLALDKALLGISFLGLMAYCTLTIIAGLGVTDSEVDVGLTTADAAIVMIEAVLQTVFLVTSFLPRRATTQEQRQKRPGRQGLFFLLCCNFCLWGLNSFGLRNEIANHIQISFYSVNAWVILSHVTLPLMILYRFHSIVVISDVITHAYTPKYVGLDTHHAR